MYIPPAFRETRLDILHEVMRQFSFATLITHQAGEMTASHIPLLLHADRGPHGTLIGHLARANPQWQQFAADTEALAIFQGPHAYISPSWYETAPAVPTWNYVAVHAYGQPQIIADPALVSAYLASLVSTYESGFPDPWELSRLPVEFIEKMMKGIVVFELPITRLEGKFKLNQNRSAADREGVVRALLQSGDPAGMGIAERMKEQLGAAVAPLDTTL